jgi:hypothetical protein
MAKHRVDDVDRHHRRRPGRSGPTADHDATDDIDESQWDDVADLICTGRGRLGPAVAAAARRAGFDVMFAGLPDTAARDAEHLDGRLGITDEETVAYLRALTEDFTAVPASDSVIPTRVVDGPLRSPRMRGRLDTFHGAALRDWGTACVSSPYGVLYTRVADPQLLVSYAGTDGGAFEATVLDSIDLDPERPADSLEHWLSAVSRSDGRPTSGEFQRLVFDEGMVVGAVLGSAGGERTVRARHGVLLSLGDGPITGGAQSGDLNPRETAEVALVSRPASRFARLEFLTGELP